MRILIAGGVWPRYSERLAAALPGHELTVVADLSRSSLDAIAAADVIVANALPAATASRAVQARLVHVGGAGIEQIAVSSLPNGVTICRTMHHGPSIAEHALMVILALQRGLLVNDRDLRVGRWHNAFL